MNQMTVDTRFIVSSGVHFPAQMQEHVARLALATTVMTFPYEVMLEPQSGELLCVLTQSHQSIPTEEEMANIAQSLQQFAANVAQEFNVAVAFANSPMANEGIFDNAHDVAQTMH